MPTSSELTLLTLLAAAGLALALAGCNTLDEKQREWIFQPSDRSWWGGQQAAEGMDEVWVSFTSHETKQPVKLHGLIASNASPDAPVLLYLHGARWNVIGSAHRIRRWQEMGFTVVGIDYRGFGKSSRDLPSEALAAEDAAAAWAWLGQQFPNRERLIYGHSLGGAIALRLAASAQDERGVIVEGTFSSLRDVISAHKWGWLPIGPLLTQKFEAVADVAAIQSPLLVIHGRADSLIPSALGEKLYAAAKEPKALILVPSGSHHSASAQAQPQIGSQLKTLFGFESSGHNSQRLTP